MSDVRTRMKALLGEVSSMDFDPRSSVEPVKEADSVNLKQIVPQLVLAAQAVGMDLADDDQLEHFMKLLKTLATTKSQMVKTAVRQWTGAKAGRALRVAKKAV
jgi:hypothetical protein